MSNNTSEGSFPLFPILFVIFVTLKLCGVGVVATWSWWAVTSPLWGGLLVLVGLTLMLSMLEAGKKRGI